jgi:hypothetical protein
MTTPSKRSKPSSAISASLSTNLLTDDTIFDYGLRPRYRDVVGLFVTHEVNEVSHPCGDEVTLMAEIDAGIILGIGFKSHACCMTTALMDILCDRLCGQVVGTLVSLTPEEVVTIPIGYGREGCIKLPFELMKALYAKAQAVRPEGTGVGDPASDHQDAG